MHIKEFEFQWSLYSIKRVSVYYTENVHLGLYLALTQTFINWIQNGR